MMSSPPETAPERDQRSKRFEVLVGLVLRVGVIVSTLLLTAGLVWHWRMTGRASFDYRIQNVNFYQFLFDDVRDLANGHVQPRLLISLGIATLLLTPYLRVFASIVYFAAVEHDFKYTVFTGFVFAVLTYSLLLH